ncbi:hypothetical protein KKG41_01580 [Patescibacteria group bacterium]|nr:hypothetical protein [Patescibacteria group bacterium]
MLTKKEDCYQPSFELACRYDSGCPYCTQHMDRVNAEGKEEWEKKEMAKEEADKVLIP